MNHEKLKQYLGNDGPRPNDEANQDPFLAEALDGLKQWRDEHPGASADELFLDLDRLVDDWTPAPLLPKRPKRHQPGLILAAACLAGLICFGLYRLVYPPHQPERLFALNFRPLAHPDMTLRGQPGSGNPEYAAVHAYETEDYKQALYHYRKLLALDPGNEQYLLFLGISCLGADQPEQAAAILKEPFTVRTSYQDDRLWYLALAWVRLGNYGAARTALMELTGSAYYAPLAGSLLKAFP